MKKINSKLLILFLAGIGLAGISCSVKKQNTKDPAPEQAIVKVIKAFKEKDAATLNKMISPETGVTVFFRNGVFNQYEKTYTIDFENPVPHYYAYPDFSTDYKVQFKSLPTYSCDTNAWSKTGIYVDTTKTDHFPSNALKSLKKYAEIDIPESEISAFEALEEKSHRVVLADDEGNDLMFYITLIDHKWYLTFLDRVSSDCST